MNTGIALFEQKEVRKVWDGKQWYFVLEDIIVILVESNDPKQYIKKMRQRDSELNQGWVQLVPTLWIETIWWRQKMNCVNTEWAFRIIQSIPSPKAEPFKRWLAKVWYERIEEIENPELAQERMKQLYEQKGYPQDRIDKRLRGIAIRQNLTDEWKQRGITKKRDYAILTAEISKATFGITPSEYKKLKKNTRKIQNKSQRSYDRSWVDFYHAWWKSDNRNLIQRTTKRYKTKQKSSA